MGQFRQMSHSGGRGFSFVYLSSLWKQNFSLKANPTECHKGWEGALNIPKKWKVRKWLLRYLNQNVSCIILPVNSRNKDNQRISGSWQQLSSKRVTLSTDDSNPRCQRFVLSEFAENPIDEGLRRRNCLIWVSHWRPVPEEVSQRLVNTLKNEINFVTNK